MTVDANRVSDEQAEALADREWWQTAGDTIGLRLVGWTYRDEAQFLDSHRTVILPGTVAERLLSLRRSPSLSGGEVVAVAWASPEALRKLAGGSPTAVEPKEFEEATTPLITLSSHQSVIAAKDAEIERVTRERDDFQSGYIKALDKIEAAEARAKAAVEALTPFAARCDEAVRSDDSDNDGVTVKTKHLRAARAFLSTLNGAKP